MNKFDNDDYDFDHRVPEDPPKGKPLMKSEVGKNIGAGLLEELETVEKKIARKAKAKPEPEPEEKELEPVNRLKARELVMQLIFQMEAQQDFSQDQIDRYREDWFDMETGQLDYYDELTAAFVENREKIDALIEQYSKGWHVSRMGKVDLAVMRLCVAEIAFLNKDDVPVNVSVGEAIKLAKKFGGDESGKFVNGILGSIARSLQ